MGKLDIYNLKNRYLFQRYLQKARQENSFVHPSNAMRMPVYGRYMQNMQGFKFSVIIFMYIIRCNDQIIGNIGSTVDSDEAGTAAETAEGGDSISTAYVGRRWYTS